MFKVLGFVSLLLVSCVTTPVANKNTYRVTWPDKSEPSGVWACFAHKEREKEIVCVDLETFLEYSLLLQSDEQPRTDL